MPCWAKPADDGRGWILRLHEVLGRRGEAEILLAPGYAARRTELTEKPGATVRRLDFGPNELVSVRIARTGKTAPARLALRKS